MNFSDAIKRLVDHARQEAARDHAERQAETAAEVGGGAKGKEAAARLLNDLPGRLLQISMQSAGAMHWASEAIASGGAEFQLRWIDPEPERILSIVVEDAGLVLWGWFSDRIRPAYKRMNAAGFTDALLMGLVEALGDQAAWEDGREPDVHLG